MNIPFLGKALNIINTHIQNPKANSIEYFLALAVYYEDFMIGYLAYRIHYKTIPVWGENQRKNANHDYYIYEGEKLYQKWLESQKQTSEIKQKSLTKFQEEMAEMLVIQQQLTTKVYPSEDGASFAGTLMSARAEREVKIKAETQGIRHVGSRFEKKKEIFKRFGQK